MMEEEKEVTLIHYHRIWRTSTKEEALEGMLYNFPDRSTSEEKKEERGERSTDYPYIEALPMKEGEVEVMLSHWTHNLDKSSCWEEEKDTKDADYQS